MCWATLCACRCAPRAWEDRKGAGCPQADPEPTHEAERQLRENQHLPRVLPPPPPLWSCCPVRGVLFRALPFPASSFSSLGHGWGGGTVKCLGPAIKLMKDSLIGEKDRKPWYNLLPCLESETLKGKFRERQFGTLTTLFSQKLIRKMTELFTECEEELQRCRRK